MKVRCGACHTEFDVSGAGRHPCPHCGAVNQVGAMPAGGPAAAGPVSDPGPGAGAPTRPDPVPVSRVTCPDCGFEFVVGEVSRAPCPMCSTTVEVAPT